ncbi:MAG: hypothetical protein EBU72_14315 [Betaproteobacteria bacterium]|nr:hypothetical protein [Betaproteobacteria bacterium]
MGAGHGLRHCDRDRCAARCDPDGQGGHG